jgi:hypothetical protein
LRPLNQVDEQYLGNCKIHRGIDGRRHLQLAFRRAKIKGLLDGFEDNIQFPQLMDDL